MTTSTFFDYDTVEPSLTTYFADIKRLGLDLLTLEQEIELAQRIEAGDTQALETLICANLRLVKHISGRYATIHLSQQDLIQEGNIGLMHAAKTYDWRKGNKFSTYATYWIRQGITRAIADKERIIDIPVHVSDDIKIMRKALRRLPLELGHEPNRGEVAHECGWTVSYVMRLEKAMLHTYSLDVGTEEFTNNAAAGDMTLAECIMDTEDQYQAFEDNERWLELVEDIERVISQFGNRGQDIIRRRLGLDGRYHSLNQIGHDWHISRERVRQVEEVLLPKIRQALKKWEEEMSA